MKTRLILVAFAPLIVSGFGTAALAEGDAERGEAVFKKQCSICHATAAGAHKMGPSMAGVYGMQAGSSDFNRYMGLKDVDFVWNDENLDKFLADPRGFLGRQTTMVSPTEDAGDRSDVIAYLKTLK